MLNRIEVGQKFALRSIGWKFFAGFATMVVVMAAVGVGSLWSTARLAGAMERTAEVTDDGRRIADFALAFKSMQEIPTDYMAVGDTAARKEYEAVRVEADRILKGHEAEAESGERRLWAVVREQFKVLDATATEILKLEQPVGHASGPALMDRVDNAVDKAFEAINKVQAMNADELKQARASATEADRIAGLVTYAVGGLGLVLAVVLGILLTLSVLRPVRTLDAVAAAMAGGDLTARAAVAGRDELARLAASFNRMAEQMADAMRTVRQATEQVASSSEHLQQTSDQSAKAAQEVAQAITQVASGANEQSRGVGDASNTVEELRKAVGQIASGAQEQARQVQLTSQTVQNMARAIDTVAGNANNVAAAATQATQTARNGAQVVEKTVEGMGRIQTTVLESAARIKELGKYSEQIGEIIQVITDIADQTNLLALNAAIEAARAGEHGKGFAVVAEEVRKLAERAGKSAKEIADLIRSIQDGTTSAVHAMEQGTTEVDQGSKLAAEAGRALNEILSAVEQAAREVQQISAAAQQVAASSREVVKSVDSVASITEENTAATEEMAAGADQVTRAMEGVASVSQENAAAAEQVSASVEEMTASTEEIAASAQSLAATAQELQAQVARFRL